MAAAVDGVRESREGTGDG